MIRIILIDEQVCEGMKEYSFWDTITDKFIMFNDTQMWESLNDFIEDFNAERFNPYKENIERFIDKIPNKYK